MALDVYITGMGIVSGIGIGVEQTRISLLEKKSGIKPLRYLQTIHDLPCAEVDLSEDQMRDMLHIAADEVVTRTALMAMLATREALQQAKLAMDGTYRVAFIHGTTVGGMEKSEVYYFDFLQNDVYSDFIEAHDCGACTEKIADYFGGFSFVSTPSTACSSAANACILGANLLEANVVDIAVVGGSECITKFHLNGFKSLMILDSQQCRPFDENRAGLNLGEGAAFIVMESKQHAQKRGVKPLCKLSGYGNACDAYHQTASSPDGQGAYLAMNAALAMSGLHANQIQYINAHGTGTPNNDESEGQAIVRVFGNIPPYVSSTKSLTGHTTSAAGGVEAVISILALQHKFVPANCNFTTQMHTLPFTPVTDVLLNTPLTHVLSNSFGFGGNNTSLIFSNVE